MRRGAAQRERAMPQSSTSRGITPMPHLQLTWSRRSSRMPSVVTARWETYGSGWQIGIVLTLLQMGLTPRALESDGFEWGRGGSWYDSAQIARASSRGNNGGGAVPPATVSGAPPIEPFRDGGAHLSWFPGHPVRHLRHAKEAIDRAGRAGRYWVDTAPSPVLFGDSETPCVRKAGRPTIQTSEFAHFKAVHWRFRPAQRFLQFLLTETSAPRFPGRSGFEASSIFLELIFKCELEKSRVVVGAGRSDLTEVAVLYRVSVIGVWRNL
jgi:hypothetical protein